MHGYIVEALDQKVHQAAVLSAEHKIAQASLSFELCDGTNFGLAVCKAWNT